MPEEGNWLILKLENRRGNWIVVDIMHFATKDQAEVYAKHYNIAQSEDGKFLYRVVKGKSPHAS